MSAQAISALMTVLVYNGSPLDVDFVWQLAVSKRKPGVYLKPQPFVNGARCEPVGIYENVKAMVCLGDATTRVGVRKVACVKMKHKITNVVNHRCVEVTKEPDSMKPYIASTSQMVFVRKTLERIGAMKFGPDDFVNARDVAKYLDIDYDNLHQLLEMGAADGIKLTNGDWSTTVNSVIHLMEDEDDEQKANGEEAKEEERKRKESQEANPRTKVLTTSISEDAKIQIPTN